MKLILTFILLSITSLVLAESSLEFRENKTTERHRYNFGVVQVGFRMPISYRFTNDTEADLVFKKATIQGMFYSAYHNCNKTLAPKQSCSFTINYSPLFEGAHYGLFRLGFEPSYEIEVDVFGWARESL